MRPPDVHEALATLYLRLNGYFTTGLILHSDIPGRARTDIDCLAVRHAYHAQPSRDVDTAEFLGAWQGETDLILCEVKSCEEQLRFNPPIRDDPEVLHDMLRWCGLFEEAKVHTVAERLQPLLEEGVTTEDARVGIVEGGYRVRALLCCPPCDESIVQWCLTGSEIFRFAEQCFNPSTPRDSCSTRYNFQQWGHPLTPIVRYLKDAQRLSPATLEDLYKYLGAG